MIRRCDLIVLPGGDGTVAAEGGPLPPVAMLDGILATPGLAADGGLRVVIAADTGRFPGRRRGGRHRRRRLALCHTSESAALKQALAMKAGWLEEGTLALQLAQALVSCDLPFWLPGLIGAAFRVVSAVAQLVGC